MTEKMTYAKALTVAIEAVDNGEVREKLEALKDSINKKNGRKSNAPTKTQRENEGLKAEILEFMVEGQDYSVTEIYKAFGDKFSSPQKVSALIRQLKDNGDVMRIEEKGKARFSKAC